MKHGQNLQLTGGNNKADRRELDFYPTPKDVTAALLDFLKLPIETIIWEPACGDYAMSSVMEQRGYCVIKTDIKHGQDYFTTHEQADAIITNPPFNTSERFITKAIQEAKTVAMLVKSQYWHARKRASLFMQHPPEWVLPLTWRPDFLGGAKGGAPTMECIWTVWNREYTGNAKYFPLLKPETFN